MVKQAERHPLLGVLAQHGEYLRLREALDKGKGPSGVFGLTEGNRSHMAATLFADLGRPLLIIVPSENAAEKMSQEISSFLPAQHFPARDVPLTGEYASSDGIEARRVAALCRLAGGDSPMILCASIEAVMQRLAPPDAFLARTYRVKAGDVISPRELLSRLLAAGYTRAEVCESRGQACLRGGYLDVFPTAAENPVRIEFFDDEVDTLRTYDPLTQRSIENIQEARFLPAVEMPILDGARKRAIKALSRRPACSELLEALRAGGTPGEAVRLLPLFYPESCTLLDYFQDGILLLDEPARLEESAKMLHMQYVEQCAAAIAAGEAQGEQAELLKGPLETIKAMDTPRTALFFSLTRSYGLIGTKEPFHFETRPISR